MSSYTTPKYHGNDVDGILEYSQYVNYLYHTDIVRSNNSGRDDIIIFGCATHTTKLIKVLRFEPTLDPATRASIVDVIKNTRIVL